MPCSWNGRLPGQTYSGPGTRLRPRKCVDSLGTQQPATNLRLLVDSGIGDMVPQIISIFLESAPGDMEKMRIALEAKDTDGLAGAAHSLKGSCSNLGASGLRDLCQLDRKSWPIGLVG